MSRAIAWLSLAVATAGVVTFVPRDASACGGCFAPQENPTVVTDHRMVFTIAKDQTTLYDQIRYTGSPASFGWVLPISGEVQVGVSSESVFQLLDVMTQTQIISPPRNCPPPPVCPNDGAFGGSSADAGAPSAGGVEVTKRETVGPYDTVQLKASDPGALQAWLAQNGYPIPADVQPVVNQYVAEKFDFLALKLLPGKQVQDMRPVRVTTPGANVVLPLRMIAAGSGANVGISLWVLGEGRYEPQNFPTFAITADELVWDWTSSSSNYKDLRAQKTTAGQGKAWEIESSTSTQRVTFENALRNGFFDRSGRGGFIPPDPQAEAYLPVKDAQGNVTKTPVQARTEDIETLFHGVTTPRVTRMRADLAKAALATDLNMSASANQSELPTTRQVTREANQPMCPVFRGCDQVGVAPRDQAAAQTESNNDSLSGGCATIVSKAKDSSPAWLAIGGGFLALALVKAARRRRS